MHVDSGQIYQLTQLNMSEEEARARGLLPIPKEDEERVRGMNRKQRRAWAAEQRKSNR